jgi:hypothetical protein
MERGFYAPVHFEQLMLLDTWTPDGRRIESEGFGTRNMPRPIFLMDTQSEGGHLGARIAGRLDSVEVKGKVVSGDGWLLDNETGRNAAMYLETKCITGNSVDLADVAADIVAYTAEDSDEERMGVSFSKASIGATTLVGIPAFPDATAEVRHGLSGNLSHVGAFSSTSFKVASPTAPELHVTDVPMEWFSGEEGRGAYPLTVEADGRVHGYLADWKQWHLSAAGRVRAPRGNGYSHFNASTVLTPDGPVSTGPLVIGGDHAGVELGWSEAVDYYASTSFAWADVHVSDDRHGIRVNGMVRPGVPSEVVHAGRASRLSGDWRRIKNRMELIAALSVNTPAFPVGRSFSTTTGDLASLVLYAPDTAPEPEVDTSALAVLRARIIRNELAGL